MHTTTTSRRVVTARPMHTVCIIIIYERIQYAKVAEDVLNKITLLIRFLLSSEPFGTFDHTTISWSDPDCRLDLSDSLTGVWGFTSFLMMYNIVLWLITETDLIRWGRPSAPSAASLFFSWPSQPFYIFLLRVFTTVAKLPVQTSTHVARSN